MPQKKECKNESAGIFVPAGLFIGMGLGIVYNNIPAGIFFGLGAGFLLLALAKMMKK
jgi:hypothetical protein